MNAMASVKRRAPVLRNLLRSPNYATFGFAVTGLVLVCSIFIGALKYEADYFSIHDAVRFGFGRCVYRFPVVNGIDEFQVMDGGLVQASIRYTADEPIFGNRGSGRFKPSISRSLNGTSFAREHNIGSSWDKIPFFLRADLVILEKSCESLGIQIVRLSNH
jgi:hypothetical protein